MSKRDNLSEYDERPVFEKIKHRNKESRDVKSRKTKPLVIPNTKNHDRKEK